MFLTLLGSSFAADLSFVVVGDMQTDGSESSINSTVFPQLVEDMNTHSPDVGLFVGDLVGGSGSVAGTVTQWADFNAVVAGFVGFPMVVPGNHDVYGGAGTFDAFRETFDWLPTDDSPPGEEGISYYLDHDGVRFISITSDQEVSNPYDVSNAGMVWLDRVLSESDSFEHVFVMTHHPVTFSDEGGLGNTSGDFWQTLVGYGVAGLFTGHWHRYQPSQPGAGGSTWETIIGTGGGYIGFAPIRPYQQRHGFMLVEVTGSEAIATFYGDEDGDGQYDDVVDRFTMAGDVSRGLVARYTFDEDATDSAPQPLGRGIDAERRGDAAVAGGGISGSALTLDGAGDYAVAGAIDDYVLNIKSPLTLSLWARIDTLRSGEWSNALLNYATNDYYTEDEQSNYAYWLNVESDGRIRMFWEHGSGSNVSLFSEPSGIEDGEWHHVAVTRQGGAVSFYIDGTMLGEPQSFSESPTGGGRGMLYLGADTEDGGNYNLSGALDEVCIFDIALEPEQIVSLTKRSDCADFNEDAPKDTTKDTGDTSGPEDTDTPEDTSTPVDTDEPPTDESTCGCTAGGVPGLLALLPAMLVALGRRYRMPGMRARRSEG